MNALVALVALVAAGLAGIVGFELMPSAEVERAPAAVRATGASDAPVPAAAAAASATGGTASETLLARPLFSQTRRPPDVAGPASTVAGGAEPLPRMTGILIDGPNRRAMFAGGQGGKTVTVVEGDRLGAYTVQSIGPRQVTLVGPDGPRTVRTTFDASLVAPAPAASFALPQFPGIHVLGSGVSGQLPGGAPPSPGVPSNPFNSQPAPPGLDAGTGSSAGAAR